MTTPEPTTSHAAYDAMDVPPEPTAVGGGDWEDLANQ